MISNQTELRELIFSLLVQYDSLSLVMPNTTRIPTTAKDMPFYICPQAATALIDELTAAGTLQPQDLIAIGLKYLYPANLKQNKETQNSRKRKPCEPPEIAEPKNTRQLSFFDSPTKRAFTKTWPSPVK